LIVGGCAPGILDSPLGLILLTVLSAEQLMAHDETPPAITPELVAEFEEAVRQAMSSRRDPEAMRRAAERMDRMREETYRKHGLLNIGVPAIRELRGELPE
jgi:hypothetical protein